MVLTVLVAEVLTVSSFGSDCIIDYNSSLKRDCNISGGDCICEYSSSCKRDCNINCDSDF